MFTIYNSFYDHGILAFERRSLLIFMCSWVLFWFNPAWIPVAGVEVKSSFPSCHSFFFRNTWNWIFLFPAFRCCSPSWTKRILSHVRVRLICRKSSSPVRTSARVPGFLLCVREGQGILEQWIPCIHLQLLLAKWTSKWSHFWFNSDGGFSICFSYWDNWNSVRSCPMSDCERKGIRRGKSQNCGIRSRRKAIKRGAKSICPMIPETGHSLLPASDSTQAPSTGLPHFSAYGLTQRKVLVKGPSVNLHFRI